MKSWMAGSPSAMAVRFMTYVCGRGKPLSVQSSAWSLNVASTDEERDPTNVLTPVSVPYGEHIHSCGPPPRASRLPRE